MLIGIRNSIFTIQLQPYILVWNEAGDKEEYEIKDLGKEKKIIIDRIVKKYKHIVEGSLFSFKTKEYHYDQKTNIITVKVVPDKYLNQTVKHFGPNITPSMLDATQHTMSGPVYAAMVAFIIENYGEAAADTWQEGDNVIFEQGSGEDSQLFELNLRLLNVCMEIDDGSPSKNKNGRSSSKRRSSRLRRPAPSAISTPPTSTKRKRSRSKMTGSKKSRSSPSESATLYKVGTKKKGNDGNTWMIKQFDTKFGPTKRWVLVKKQL